MRCVLPFAVTASILALACSSSSNGTPPADAGVASDSPVVSCANDPRVDAYAANLVKSSAQGTFKVTLTSANPAPPALENNAWTITVQDASGKSMVNAPLQVSTYMPDHGHTSTVKPQIMPNADGTYAATDLDFFMAGVWRVRFTMASDAGVPDTVDFFFCVEG